jgi:hypothetical protein
LQIQPKARAGVEVTREPQRRVGTYSSAAMDDFRDSRHRYVKIKRQPVHAELERFHEICSQNFAGVYGRKQLLRFGQSVLQDWSRKTMNMFSNDDRSVIVNDLNFVRITFPPNEAKTPLISDANTILAHPVAV